MRDMRVQVFVAEEERKQAAGMSFWHRVLWNYAKPGDLGLGAHVYSPDLWTSFIGFGFDLH